LAWVGVAWEIRGFRTLGLAWVGEKLVTVLVTVPVVSGCPFIVQASMRSILSRFARSVKGGGFRGCSTRFGTSARSAVAPGQRVRRTEKQLRLAVASDPWSHAPSHIGPSLHAASFSSMPYSLETGSDPEQNWHAMFLHHLPQFL